MKPDHKLFVAIPFDSATLSLYDRALTHIRRDFPNLTTVIGNQEVGPSPKYANIASFRSQNRELTNQFVAQIRNADIIVADLTHNNPNVHVELGIALLQNKNILRVTGRSLTELGFDIRNLEVRTYKTENDLTKILSDYLKTFFTIKQLTLLKRHGSLYFRELTPLGLKAAKLSGFDIQSNLPRRYLLRDGAIRATFKFRNTLSPEDWFGVYFRSGVSPLLGSHLVYVRRNGSIELAMYPGPQVLDRFSIGRALSDKETLTLDFENDYVEMRVGKASFSSRKLYHQVAGKAGFASWQADVDVSSAEMISRDTIEWS